MSSFWVWYCCVLEDRSLGTDQVEPNRNPRYRISVVPNTRRSVRRSRRNWSLSRTASSPSFFRGRLLRQIQRLVDGRVSSHVHVFGSQNPVPSAVGDVVPHSEDAVVVDPTVGTDHGAIFQPFLLAVLSAQGLVPEVAVRTFVRLDVVLEFGRVAPVVTLGKGRRWEECCRHLQSNSTLVEEVVSTTYQTSRNL